MSDNYLRLIPNDPNYIPDDNLQLMAYELFGLFTYKEDLPEFQLEIISAKDGVIIKSGKPDWGLRIETYDHPQFIDCGCNLETLSCPHCDSVLTFDWWYAQLGISSVSQFDDLSCVLPCCGIESTLNEIKYDWPAGFARFLLEAYEGHKLTESELKQLEAILCCQIRQIQAHI